MRTAEDALWIAVNTLRLMLRSKETWVWAFVMPPMFFYFMGMMSGGGRRVDRGGEVLELEAPEEERQTPAMLALERNLQKREWKVVFRTPGSAKGARVLTVPAGFSARLLSGENQSLVFRRKAGQSNDEMRVNLALYQTLADLAVVDGKGQGVTAEALGALAAKPRQVAVVTESAGRRVRTPSGYEHAVPGTLVMFTMLVLLTSGAAGLVVERQEGILRRLASSPMSRGSVVLGKWLGRMVLAGVQVAVGMATGTLAFGVNWGGNLWAVCLLLALYAAMAAFAALWLGSVAKSPGQAVAVAVLGTNAMAALGGCWWPIEITPRWAQALSLAVPTGWAMEAMHKLVSFGLPASSVLPHAMVLGSLALVTGWVAVRKMRFD